MDDRLARLLELAYRTAPAAEANRAISEAREEAAAAGASAARPARGLEGSLPLGRSYEMVIDPGVSWERFAAEALPRLVYHLESVSARTPSCMGLVVAA